MAVDRPQRRCGSACYEMLHEPDVPTKVAINEAIELGKRYSTEQSGAFINGILDRIRKDRGLKASGARHRGPVRQAQAGPREDARRARGRAAAASCSSAASSTRRCSTELEEALLKADVGPKTTDGARRRGPRGVEGEDARRRATRSRRSSRARIAERLRTGGNALARAATGPTVILVCGVNGSGKTTSIGKLTKFLKRGRQDAWCSARPTPSARPPSSSSRSGASATASRS